MRGENQVIMHDCLLESTQDLSCTYLAHHELESVAVVINNITITVVIILLLIMSWSAGCPLFMAAGHGAGMCQPSSSWRLGQMQ